MNAFVHNSQENQAACYYTDNRTCLIRLSSSLVNLLDPDELEFVIGHELGHFLLQHAPNQTSKKTVEFFVFQRAKEISADRIGLIGCGSLDVAMRTMLKIASGLRSNFLQMDKEQFIQQINQIKKPSLGENPFNTHPSILMRALALEEFAPCLDGITYQNLNIEQVYNKDKSLILTLEKYVDQPFKAHISRVKEDLGMWMAIKLSLEDKKFDKEEQSIFEERFGKELAKKIKDFISSNDSQTVSAEIASKIDSCKKRLLSITPNEAEALIIEIRSSIENLLKK